MRKYLTLSAAALIVAGLGTGPAWAQLGVDLGIVDAEVDLNSDDGLGVGADVNVGGDDGVGADADVNVGGSDRVVDADVDANVGGDRGVDASVDVGVGGDDGDLVDADVDIGVGGGGNGGGGNGGGDDDDNGNGDGNGGGNGNGGGMIPGGPGSSSGGSGSTAGISCVDQNAPLFAQLSGINYSSDAVSNWSSASSVAFVPIGLCPGLDGQLGSGLLAQVANTVPPLQSALAQSSYSAGDILGIVQSGMTLNVYVD